MSRFGEQPAIEAIKDQHWSLSAVARELGETRGHLSNSIYGRCSPCGRLRESLPKLLGVPLEKLFTPESLADRYRQGDGWAPTVRRQHSPEAKQRLADAARRQHIRLGHKVHSS